MKMMETTSDHQQEVMGKLEIENTSTLIDLLELRVRQTPLLDAVIDIDRTHQYLSFYQETQVIGRYLMRFGAGTNRCIGLFCEPSVEMMCGAWGILQAGRAYLPLSPDYPVDRLKYMIEDSGVEVIYAQDHLREQLQEFCPLDVQIICPEDIPGNEAHNTEEEVFNRPSVIHENSLAYIIYTSGSTGKPKGVMVEHASVVSQMQYLQDEFEFGVNTRILQKTPMSFDAAQWEILAPVFGGQTIIGPPGCYRDPDMLIMTMIGHEVTALQCVPTLLQALVDNPCFAECFSLNKIFSGGEALTKSLSKQFFEVFDECELINLYGPTECTINSSIFKLNRDLLESYPNVISIGKPVRNLEYYVLDSEQQPVIPGEMGELYVAGLNVSRGYMNRPEMTAEKFLENPFSPDPNYNRMYRTGDLVIQDTDGNIHFSGRTDNQVKLRGYRVELDEIRHAIEEHSWIKTAAVLIKADPRTRYQNLIACVELDEKEAAIMDQGNHDPHHQSKSSKLQVKAQLSNEGCRSDELCANRLKIELVGGEETPEQRRFAFGRKTYRFFDGNSVTEAALLNLLLPKDRDCSSRPLTDIGLVELGHLLRFFGQFKSEHRLLPKYAYASPGALYTTQLYLEIHGLFGLQSGIYYYHPVQHQLVLVADVETQNTPRIKTHFIGKYDAIETVYKNNIVEVLEMEAGHMLGVFDDVLPEFGLGVGKGEHFNGLPDWYDGATNDYYIAEFEIVSAQEASEPTDIELYVQAHGKFIKDMPEGLYRYKNEHLERISDDVILRRDVIAINQQVYDRASFGVAVVRNGGDEWRHYIDLGRKLHALQSNSLLLGMMSSGYSSKTGNDLPSARRMRQILEDAGHQMEAFYFAIGGCVSELQYSSDGMREDAVHMQGPAELLKEDLAKKLPQFMIPNKVVVMNDLPQTANGKVDYEALANSKEVEKSTSSGSFAPLETDTEKRLGKIWAQVMNWEAAYAEDDFFETGGNSLMAVALVNKINNDFDTDFPLQVLFQYPNISQLAKWVDGEKEETVSRFIQLNDSKVAVTERAPVFCWPGLGGYPMNLKNLGENIESQRLFYGVQSKGLSAGEEPYGSIVEMAEEDIKEIRKIQPKGPYTLWGYSFGSRVAFETAHQLEQSGETVEALYLIAPGSPSVHYQLEASNEGGADFSNPVFVTILFSVFAHTIESPMLKTCLERSKDESSFINFICSRFRNLDKNLVSRIVKIVALTYEFEYSFREMNSRNIKAPVKIFKATGDNYSFIEKADDFSVHPPEVIDLKADHYQLLKDVGMQEIGPSL